MLCVVMLKYTNKLFRFFVAVAPGLEEIVEREVLQFIENRKMCKMHREYGGISYRVSLQEGFSLLQKLRTPNKMLMRLGTKKTTSLTDISTLLNNSDLIQILSPNTPCQFTIHSHKSKLFRKDIVLQKAERVIKGILGQPDNELPTQKLQIRIANDFATLSIQVHSGHLYQRGWRTRQGKASLRENIAAVLLKSVDWNTNEPLYDPFCGSGTIPIEAGRMKSNLPTRLHQVESWHNWNNVSTLIPKTVQNPEMIHLDNIYASDKYPPAISACQYNAYSAQVSFSIQNLSINLILPPTNEPGVVVCNPPYGHRLGKSVHTVYRLFGERMREHFHGWRAVFLCPSMKLARRVDAKVSSLCQFSQGGLNVHICKLDTIQ